MGSTSFRTFLALKGSTDPCVTAFPTASSTTTGNTTSYDREASVQAIICAGFGGDVKFKIDDGVKCSLLAAAIGSKFARTGAFIDGSCSGVALATDPGYGTTAAVACSMLSDLLGTDPELKVFAIGAGVSCSFGHALGAWIESVGEAHAADAVFQHGKCLQFSKHGFPVGDTWLAVDCKRGDHGFSTASAPTRPLPTLYDGAAGASAAHAFTVRPRIVQLIDPLGGQLTIRWTTWTAQMASGTGTSQPPRGVYRVKVLATHPACGTFLRLKVETKIGASWRVEQLALAHQVDLHEPWWALESELADPSTAQSLGLQPYSC
jgi:hypothetical protein